MNPIYLARFDFSHSPVRDRPSSANGVGAPSEPAPPPSHSIGGRPPPLVRICTLHPPPAPSPALFISNRSLAIDRFFYSKVPRPPFFLLLCPVAILVDGSFSLSPSSRHSSFPLALLFFLLHLLSPLHFFLLQTS